MTKETDFDQFVDFIAHFSAELASGISPEYALVRTRQHFGNQTPQGLDKVLFEIVEGSKSFPVAWNDFVNKEEQNSHTRLIELLGRFIDKGSIVGGERMLQVIKQVRKNSTVLKNRQNLINSQKMKVISLTIVSSIVIGMIAALAPLLTYAFYYGDILNPAPLNPGSPSLQIFIALFITVIITGYRLTQTVGGTLRTVLMSITSFGSTYLLMTQLLVFLM